MSAQSFLRKTCCLAIVLGALSVMGCGGSAGQFNVMVSIDKTWRDQGAIPSVEVHLVGVNNSEYATWQKMSMTGYWKDAERGDRSNPKVYVMKFGQGKDDAQTLPKGNPIWKTWKQGYSRYLFVLADLPGGHKDEPGDADSRRLILPLDPNAWRKVKYVPVGGTSIEINITKPPSGIYCLNAPKSKPE